jgi:sec-independent protein translocase protein TatA
MSSASALAFFFGGTPSTPELMVVLLAALLLFGAKRLPEIARGLGKSMEEFRRAARDVTDEIMHAEAKPTRPAPKPLPPRQTTEPARADVQEPADGAQPADEGRVDDGTA